MTGLVLLVALGATYRLTMLVTHDKLTEALRESLLSRITGHGIGRAAASITGGHVIAYTCAHDPHGDVFAPEDLAEHIARARADLSGWRRRVCYLVTCPWCVSQHVGGVVMASAWAFGDRSWWFVPAAALTGSAVTGTWARFARPS